MAIIQQKILKRKRIHQIILNVPEKDWLDHNSMSFNFASYFYDLQLLFQSIHHFYTFS